MRDIQSDFEYRTAIAAGSKSAALAGEVIDLQGSSGIGFIVSTGSVNGDGDFGLTLQESDTGAEFKDVDAAQVNTSVPATLQAGSAYSIGYLGYKRYVRLALTKAGGTSINIGVVAVLRSNTRPAA